MTDFRSLGDDGSPGGRASLDPPDPRVAARVLEATVVHHRRSVIAALTRRFGDLDLAEDAFQDAIGEALRVWPTGMPSTNPAGWLLTVAQRRALDRLRRESVRADREWRATSRLVEDGEIIGSERDDQLALVLTCCHPALSVEAQVALTLKAVAGLSTGEIARAFLVADATMAQRLVRAKRKIATAGIPFKVPVGDDLVDRLASACSVVYLVFNEGYRASEGEELVRHDVCDEAIRLGRLLHELVPDDDEVAALLALMLLTDARRATRLDDAGELVLLEDQDRSQWDQFRIREGLGLLAFPSIGAAVGPFRIQAEIARAHTEAVSFAHTDWARIASLYAVMARATGSPVVALNFAVARSMAEGPAVGLALVDRLIDGGELASYALAYSARADLLRRLDRWNEAAAAYDQALAHTATGPERRYLAGRRAEVEANSGGRSEA